MKMANSLQSRKHKMVREAIYDAAIELFAAKGFDETTVEEVANAAGVSRRSFFRYFASKGDLLARNVVSYGEALAQAVAACPASMNPLETIRETLVEGAKYAASQPRTRQTIEIAEKSVSARQAHRSRLMEVEDRVAEAFAARIRGAAKDDLHSRMLAGVTLLLMNLTVFSWFNNEREDLSTSYHQVFTSLTRVLCEKSSTPPDSEDSYLGRKRSSAAARVRSRS